MNTTETTIHLAAIVQQGKDYTDALLHRFIGQLKSQGSIVRGLVPDLQNSPDTCYTHAIRDLETDIAYPIKQNLGKESTACCLDTGALLAAGAVLRRAMQGHADLVIVNRFGILETEGKGFNDEIIKLVGCGYPVLTVVSASYLQAWREFTGGIAQELPPDLDSLMHWFKQVRVTSPDGVSID